MSDALGRLIDTYNKVVREHGDAQIGDFDLLVADLKEAAALRNALCHGSWRAPNDAGQSVLFYVNRKKEIFDTPIDIAFLEQTQKSVTRLAANVVSSVTAMGYQFPGSTGPGEPLMDGKA
ncbi:MAG: hypothetical protein AAF950_18015 [Pseudomonadota bacterium]